ncbi:IclR family transcriptional regulator [Mycobacterium sp. pW049]|uniref:IclR family transcriptional regulator n=1 Tax=[Mycobacterium] bulgaricum TaxID=3238985 RepID=UPI00351B035C
MVLHADAPASMVARVALILGCFDQAGRVLRLDQVAARAGLPRSSVHRILTQLHGAGLLQHRSDGYCLAASSLPGAGSGDHSALRAAAAPVLERLQSDTMLVVQLGVLIGSDVVYLDKFSGTSGVAVPVGVGDRTPAHASALGKAILATLPAETVDELLGCPLRKSTPATVADLPSLHSELVRIRSRHGLAYDDQELVAGLAGIAAPILGADGLVAGLSLTGPAPAERLTRMAPFLTRAARSIAERIGSTSHAAGRRSDLAAVTDDMLSRVLRTLSSDDWV